VNQVGDRVNFYVPGKRPFQKSARRVGVVKGMKLRDGTVSKYVLLEETEDGTEIEHRVKAGALGIHPPPDPVRSKMPTTCPKALTPFASILSL